MSWRKQGLIFSPPTNLGWMHSHAALPVPQGMNGYHRIYFSGRDNQGRAQIGSFDISSHDMHTLVAVQPSYVIGLGKLGAFDDSGVTSACIVDNNGYKYQYYTGWSLGVSVPFYFYIGLAISTDGGLSYQKYSDAPILGRTHVDPYLTASPHVLIDNGIWRMWYVSGSRWEMFDGKARHYYHIRYAESTDGIRWNCDGTVCIDYASPQEYAIARPWVIQDGGIYKMWYSFRGDRYQLGYAESEDGIHWVRKDEEVGISRSKGGWDSQMIAYASIFDFQGQRYMLYNGNDYGKTGIGLAIWTPE